MGGPRVWPSERIALQQRTQHDDEPGADRSRDNDYKRKFTVLHIQVRAPSVRLISQIHGENQPLDGRCVLDGVDTYTIEPQMRSALRALRQINKETAARQSRLAEVRGRSGGVDE